MKSKMRDEGRRTNDELRDRHPGTGEQAGEAVGGIGGTLAGAALGSVAGPLGTILGGLAGAFGGWWAGEKAGRAAEDLDEHDDYYRAHWDENRHEKFDYDEARVGYGVGHLAGRNPEWSGRSWDMVETDLRRGWSYKHDFDTMRPYVRAGYERTMAERSMNQRPKSGR